jgi:formate-dependent phosphoribosylglycinamide formyltransferase (GAR transformylase)
MKKVLLLYGSYFQVPSVKTAKELGSYVITCDYLPENPGHKFADKYYSVNTTDKDAVLDLSKNLRGKSKMLGHWITGYRNLSLSTLKK